MLGTSVLLALTFFEGERIGLRRYSDFITDHGYVISLDYRGISRIQSPFHFEGRGSLNNLDPGKTESKQSFEFIILGNVLVCSQTQNYFR